MILHESSCPWGRTIPTAQEGILCMLCVGKHQHRRLLARIHLHEIRLLTAVNWHIGVHDGLRRRCHFSCSRGHCVSELCKLGETRGAVPRLDGWRWRRLLPLACICSSGRRRAVRRWSGSPVLQQSAQGGYCRAVPVPVRRGRGSGSMCQMVQAGRQAPTKASDPSSRASVQDMCMGQWHHWSTAGSGTQVAPGCPATRQTCSQGDGMPPERLPCYTAGVQPRRWDSTKRVPPVACAPAGHVVLRCSGRPCACTCHALVPLCPCVQWPTLPCMHARLPPEAPPSAPLQQRTHTVHMPAPEPPAQAAGAWPQGVQQKQVWRCDTMEAELSRHSLYTKLMRGIVASPLMMPIPPGSPL